mmetsp:Transcript_5142/g.19270  ORF Transcript_5142/g.19270 Transcript_5142/m.19270 type:complete len:335 (-) Transcript_5142:1909-2913(-)|eukprot:CAMPEP_0117450166 /NCGR_PEP_ID=MMETSP0759-20121206/8324_1 /TAXON_ID=63605 /ORGANISM="Percolomonas cosmopolitus, Strain WS" /LENGTH=334 /DNA_ID=CAMNT_0005242671 /DNA_START=113 /DNA_END=1117 /DNA_ORIENTATION=+
MPSQTHASAKQKVAILFYSMKAKIKKKHTLYEALKHYEQHSAIGKLSQCEDIDLNGCFPPVEVMDRHGIKLIKNVKKLSLSTNKITDIADLSPLLRLEVLSLGRNEISRLENLNVARTLKELWMSFNDIDSLKGIEALKQLEVLSIAHNRIDDWAEFHRIQHLPKLEELIFSGNPLHVRFPGTKKEWRRTVLQKLPNLRRLDGERFYIIKRVSSRSESGSADGPGMEPGVFANSATPHGTHTYHSNPRFDTLYNSASMQDNSSMRPPSGQSSPYASNNGRYSVNGLAPHVHKPHHPSAQSRREDEHAAFDPAIKSIYTGRADDSEDDMTSDHYV